MNADTPSHSASRHTGARRLRILRELNFSLTSVLVLGIVILLNYFAFRHYTRFDWTSEKLYSLSSRTEKVLAEVLEPVNIYVFLSEAESNYSELRALLDRYKTGSDNVAVHLVDPDRRPGEFDVLSKRFGVGAGQLMGSDEMRSDTAAVVATQGRHWLINRDDLIGFTAESFEAEAKADQVEVRAERAITGAMVQLLHGRATELCVSRGHGEWDLAPGSQRSLSALHDSLKHDNVSMKTIELAMQEVPPEGCDALFVIGPTRVFTSAEAEVLEQYVRGGGNVLLALDPVFDRERIRPTGLESMLQALGVVVQAKLIMERDERLLAQRSSLERFFVVRYGDHSSTRELIGSDAPLMVHQVRPVEPAEDSSVQWLLRSSEEAVVIEKLAETTEPSVERGQRHPEGHSLAVAVTVPQDPNKQPSPDTGVNRVAAGRLVVVGDSDFLDARYLDAPELANFYVASALTGWLAEREALISIPAKKIRRARLDLNMAKLDALWWRVVVMMPLFAMALGLFVFWKRRA